MARWRHRVRVAPARCELGQAWCGVTLGPRSMEKAKNNPLCPRCERVRSATYIEENDFDTEVLMAVKRQIGAMIYHARGETGALCNPATVLDESTKERLGDLHRSRLCKRCFRQ